MMRPDRMIRLALCVVIASLGACQSGKTAGSASSTSTVNAAPSYDKKMFRAAEKGDRDDVEQRLEKGAAINAVNPETGRTVLHVAALNGHKKLAAYLVSAGADQDLRDNHGNTALHLAAMRGHGDTTAVLAAVTDKSIRNDEGKTASECAVGDAVIYLPRP